jgi:hypothetical protein
VLNGNNFAQLLLFRVGVSVDDTGFEPPAVPLVSVEIGPTLPGFLSDALGKAAFA